MAGERIGLLGRERVAPPGVCLAADMVTHAAREEVSTTSALPPLDLPLPDGSGSCLTFGPLFPPACTKLIRNFKTVMLYAVLKGLWSVFGMVALSSLLMKAGMDVYRNLGKDLAIVVGSGILTSGGVGSSHIRSVVSSSGPVYTVSIRAG